MNETVFLNGAPMVGFGAIDSGSGENKAFVLGLNDAAPPPNMPNPAAENCIAKGGRISGELCIFPDGSYCEQWAFMRRECAPGDTRKKGIARLVAVSLGGAAVGGVIGNHVKKGGKGAVIGTLVGGVTPIAAGCALGTIIYWNKGEAG